MTLEQVVFYNRWGSPTSYYVIKDGDTTLGEFSNHADAYARFVALTLQRERQTRRPNYGDEGDEPNYEPKPRAETAILPAFLATALINGDWSSIETDEDERWLRLAQEYVKGGDVVDVGEPYFSRYCNLPGWRGGEVAEYTVLYGG